MTKSAENGGFSHIYWTNPYRKFHFLCSPIKLVIPHVANEPVAAPEIQTVDVVKTSQLCSVEFTKIQWKENKTPKLSGSSMKTHGSFLPFLDFSSYIRCVKSVIFCILIQLTRATHTLGFSHNKINCIRNLVNTCPKNEFFTMETLHINNKINDLSFEKNINFLVISKVKYWHNHLHLKMSLMI